MIAPRLSPTTRPHATEARARPPGSMIAICLEKAEDASRIRQVNELAFGEPTEGILVDRLRQSCSEALSLVAEDDFVVVHILFTPVEVDRAGRRFSGIGLAPMAVVPDRQRSAASSERFRERGAIHENHVTTNASARGSCALRAHPHRIVSSSPSLGSFPR